MSQQENNQPGTIITFYSYKGGTGRSMAVANIAWILASNGYRVLVVDWDLEAPGLHRYFYPFMLDLELTASDGVIDLVNHYVTAAMTPPESSTPTIEAQSHTASTPIEQASPAAKWYEPYADILRYATSLDWTFPPQQDRQGWIDFIPAGRQGPSYATRMNAFNWQNFYDRLGGGGFMEAVKQKMKAAYDYVLIDSRTGVSDTSGICTVQLPDILVVCFTLNRQSIEGAGAVAESVDAQRHTPSGEPTIRIFPVPMRVEKAEKEKLDLARAAAQDRFSSLLWHIEPHQHDLYWGHVEVSYEPFYAYEEILATFGDKPHQTSSLLASMERITAYLSEPRVTALIPVSETERQKVLWRYARQQRVTKAAQPGASDTTAEFLFYVSYAREDWNEHLDTFLHDLVQEVSTLTGRPAAQVGFVGMYHLIPGEEWDTQLSQAVQRSRLLVPIYSPAYFISTWPGREFQHFLNRHAEFRRPQVGQVRISPPILPVLWIPPRPALPPAAVDIQDADEALPPAYTQEGLYFLMRLRRFHDVYREFVIQFARRLVALAERVPLPTSAVLPPLHDTPSAFERPQTDGGEAAPRHLQWHAEEFRAKLQASLASHDRQAVSALCEELLQHLRQRPEAYPATEARHILQELSRWRYFMLMERVADALIQSGQDSLPIRRRYAQALVDQDKMTAAIVILQSLIAETADDPTENAEARGLLGRAYKQLYVDATDPTMPRQQQNLALAIQAYDDGYRLGPRHLLWHGINVVALLCRAERDDVSLRAYPTPGEEAVRLADVILDQITTRQSAGAADVWDMATAAEACLALHSPQEALAWIATYVQAPHLDAFQVASTLRQLTEVWQLDLSSPPGQDMLPLLQAALLRREGGAVTLSAQDLATVVHTTTPDPGELATVIDRASFRTFAWYQTGLARAHAIARIANEAATGMGTGFLVSGKDLHPTLGNELLLMTCTHIFGEDPKALHTLRPEEAVIVFEVLGFTCRISDIVWSSPPEQLDVTLVRLDMPSLSAVTPYPIATRPPVSDTRQSVYIIGHPGGRTLSFSIGDNVFLDFEAPRMHYQALTEGGSSGSPVFNAQWQLIGIHHMRHPDIPRLNGKPGTYEAGEGIWIGSIPSALARALS